MRSFLKQNKQYINKLYDEMNAKGFSDDCGTSIIHQIIFSLSNTLKLAVDDKVIKNLVYWSTNDNKVFVS